MSLRIDVAVTPDLVGVADLPRCAVLVVDVLRASTSIITALASGCAAVVPAATPEEARRRVLALGADVLLAGERRGEPLQGFDLGNSPLEFTEERVRGRTVVFTTSNGTRALLTVRTAAAVGVAALVNRTAACAWALGGAHDVLVLCAGERGVQSREDSVCAGLLVECFLEAEPGARLTETARVALGLAETYGKDVARLRRDSPWARHLAAAGRAADVAACLVLDTIPLVPVYLPAVNRIVRARR